MRSLKSQIGETGTHTGFRCAASGEDGFTLLEVLIALVILSLSLGVLLAAFSQGLSYARENTTEADARNLAQSLIAQAETAPNPAFGDTDGQVAPLRWHMHIEPYGSGDDQKAWQQRAQKIDATVYWQNNRRSRSLSLSTLRLAPSGTGQ